MLDSTVLRRFSNNSQRDIGAEEEQQIFSGKFVKIRSRRDEVPLVEIRVGKLTDCVSPNELQKSFAEVPWQLRERYPHPANWHDDN